MPWFLLKLIIVNNFGRNSLSPYRAARARLLLTTILLVAIGGVLGQAIRHAHLPKDLPLGWLALAVSFMSYSIFGLVFLLFGSVQQYGLRGDQLLKVSTVLPLSRLYRWLMIAVPIIIIWIVMILFAVPGLYGLGYSTGHNILWLLFMAVIGSFMAFGFALNRMPGGIIVKIILFCCSVAAASSYLVHIISNFQTRHVLPVFVMEVILGAAMIARHFATFEKSQYMRTIGATHITLQSRWLKTFWFGLKTIRNGRTMGSLLFSLTICWALALGIELRNLVGANGYGWLLLSGVMTAAFASDIRGISRKHKPVEIISLKGTWHFIDREVITVYGAGLLCGLPLLIVVLLHIPQGHVAAVCYFAALQLAAGIIGLAASTAIVPGDGDTGSQFISSIMAVASLFIIPKMTRMVDRSVWLQIVGWLWVGLCGYAVIAYIEKIRRRYYGYA